MGPVSKVAHLTLKNLLIAWKTPKPAPTTAHHPLTPPLGQGVLEDVLR